MLFIYLISKVISSRYTSTFKTGYHGYATGFKGYDEVFLNIEKGEALMMVEWEDAILNISISSLGIKDLQFSKHLGYSLFTFKNPGTVLIQFSNKLSYFYFPAPSFKTGNAIQYITNNNSTQLQLKKTNYEVYVGIFGPYNLNTFITTYGKGSQLSYCYNNKWNDVNDVSHLNLKNIEYLAIFKNTNNECQYLGTVNLDSTYSYIPSVPTLVELKYGKVNNDDYKFSDNAAYGGDFLSESGQIGKLAELNQRQYVIINNDIVNKNEYQLYARKEDGEFVQIDYLDTYKEERDNEFSVDVFLLSKKCTSYSYITRVNSSNLRLDKNGMQEFIKIDNSFIPDFCYDKKSNDNNKTYLIVCIVLAVVVVILIVVIIVVTIVLKKRKSHSSQEGQSAENV